MIRSPLERDDPHSYRRQRVTYEGIRYSEAVMDEKRAAWNPGEPWPDELAVDVIEPDGTRHPLRHVLHQSVTGFEWGYLGSGPHDLALSILADYLGEDPALVQSAARSWMAEPSAALALHNLLVHQRIAHLPHRDAVASERDQEPPQMAGERWRIRGQELGVWLTEERPAGKLEEHQRRHVEWLELREARAAEDRFLAEQEAQLVERGD